MLAKKPPAPDANEGSGRALRDLYPKVKGDMLRASPDIELAATSYFRAKAMRDEAVMVMTLAENGMKAFIADNGGASGDGWRATWFERKGSVSYKQALEAAKPDASKEWLESFRSESTRVFDCKPEKAGKK